MRDPDLTYRKLVLVCTNERTDQRECCRHGQSEDFYHKLKLEIASADPTVRVSKTGCLGNCLSGPIVVIMPDNIWLGEVTDDDIPEVVRQVLKKA